MLDVGSKVRIRISAFPGSDDERDEALRGRDGEIVDDWTDIDGLWLVNVDGEEVFCTPEELEEIE